MRLVKQPPSFKEQRKKKRLWKTCTHRFAPHFEFAASAGGFYYLGEKCKRCGIVLEHLEIDDD